MKTLKAKIVINGHNNASNTGVVFSTYSINDILLIEYRVSGKIITYYVYYML